jgi:hypothetical protein
MTDQSSARRRHTFAEVSLLAANALWFGGIFHLLGEVAGPIWSASVPEDVTTGALVAGLAVASAEVLIILAIVWRWRKRLWRTLRQLQHDERAFWYATENPPPLNWDYRRAGRNLILALAPSLLIAALIPNVIVAAIAIVAGLVVRVAAAAAAFM